MMKTEHPFRPAAWVALLVVPLWLSMACAQATSAPSPTATSVATGKTETIMVSLLVQAAETDLRWFRDVELPRGANAWELTEAVAQGQVEAQFYPLYRSHFVDALFGVKGRAPTFWLIFVWSEASNKWESLPVGADLFSLKDGHVLAWYYADTSKEHSAPTAAP
jgi:hypothetical protein